MRTRVGTGVIRVVAAVAVTAPMGADAAMAQACLGYPQRSDGAVSATFTFPDDGTGYDLTGMVASQDGGLFLEGGFGVVVPDDDDLANRKSVHGGAAWEIAALAREASVCPLVEVGYSWVGDRNTWTVPFGVGAGTTVRLGRRGDAGFTPFIVPHFLYVHESVDDVEESGDSEVFVALAGGLTISVDAFRVTGGVSKIFEEDRDPVFSLSVGAFWR